MGRPKGGKNKHWNKEDKLKYVLRLINEAISCHELSKETGIYNATLNKWLRDYLSGGEAALENKRKPGNPLAKFANKKNLTEIEKLQYENMKLKIENLRLKKGYTEEEVIQIKRK